MFYTKGQKYLHFNSLLYLLMLFSLDVILEKGQRETEREGHREGGERKGKIQTGR